MTLSRINLQSYSRVGGRAVARLKLKRLRVEVLGDAGMKGGAE